MAHKFGMASKKLGKVGKLYHGSIVKLNKGDLLNCNDSYNNSGTDKINGVFATSSHEEARFFGLRGCISEIGITKLDADDSNKNIYVDNLRPTIIPQFYIYSVNPDRFNLDVRDEYVCTEDVEIQEVEIINVVDEFKLGGWHVFQVPRINRTRPMSKQFEQMNEYIKTKNFIEVDIVGILFNQRMREKGKMK